MKISENDFRKVREKLEVRRKPFQLGVRQNIAADGPAVGSGGGGGAVLAGPIDPASVHGRDSSSGPQAPAAPENT